MIKTGQTEKECQCFQIPHRKLQNRDHWYHQWNLKYQSELSNLSDIELENLASLLPMLLCGEQSAIVTFNRHAETLPLDAISSSKQLFVQIESDEIYHEKALQKLFNSLPKPDNLHQLKRKSQLFYLSLSKQINLAEQFIRISQLDSKVCLIMHAMSKSSLAKQRLMSSLFSNIMKDEARHVSISKKHAIRLGISRNQVVTNAERVERELLKLLSPMANSFDQLEVDPDKLFNRISRGH